jgi:hypothetical protein
MATRNQHPGIQPAEDIHGHPTTVRGEPVDGLPLRGPNDEGEREHGPKSPPLPDGPARHPRLKSIPRP